MSGEVLASTMLVDVFVSALLHPAQSVEPAILEPFTALNGNTSPLLS